MCEAFAPNRDYGEHRALAIVDHDEVLGGIIVHDWNTEAETAEISGVLSKPLYLRGAAREIARLIFDLMGCQAAIMRTTPENPAARLAKAMGGKEYIIPRLRGRTASEALIVITEEAWRASRWAA